MKTVLFIIWLTCMLGLIANVAIVYINLTLEQENSYRVFIISLSGTIAGCAAAAAGTIATMKGYKNE